MRNLRILLRVLTLAACALFLASCEEKPGPDESDMVRIFEEARKLDAEGRHHEAMVKYEDILARHPEWLSTRFNAALAAYDSLQFAKAAGHFEILHKADPRDWFILRKLIQTYERLDRKDKVELYRGKLVKLRERQDGSPLLKSYQGFTRDYIPIRRYHLIGYEFFEPQKHGRLWFFRLEDHHRKPLSTFLLEASPFHARDGRRLFYLSEVCNNWLRIWHVGTEGRDYDWVRRRVLEVIEGRQQPLAVKALPEGYEPFDVPGAEGAEGPPEKK